MSGKRVLVVDDEPYILRSLSYVLRKDGYEVFEARSGLEALEAVRTEVPDLVFLAVMIPEVNGFEVCRQIRQDPKLSGVRVVMLTARGQDSDRGKACGADLYMTKPFSLAELAEELISITGRGSVRSVPFPPERQLIDVGNTHSSFAKIEAALGWRPRTPLREGLERTVEFYRRHRAHYWELDASQFPRSQKTA